MEFLDRLLDQIDYADRDNALETDLQAFAEQGFRNVGVEWDHPQWEGLL